MAKIGSWLHKLINASGEKLTDEEIKAIPEGPGFIPEKCRCCGDKFVTKRGLVNHYAIVHPDLDRSWIVVEQKNT